jgi:hypothetical protein
MSRNGALEKIRRASAAVDAAKAQLTEVLEQELKIGTSVRWDVGKALDVEGVAVCVAHDRVKVRNDHTGKVYWIYCYRLTHVGGVRKAGMQR